MGPDLSNLNPDADDTLTTFLSSRAEERFQLLERGEIGERLMAYLGDDAYGEYRALAARAAASVQAAEAPVKPLTNLVFVPGMMGSLLKSNTLGGVWWIDVRTRGRLNDLKLAPDGRQDANPQHEIVPIATDTLYEPFLAAALERTDFSHRDFYFDWRKPLSASTSAFKDLIVSIHAANGGQPIHLVGHSMGGVMIRAMLAEHGDEVWPRLGRIVFIGTPHYGAPAIASYLKYHFWGFDKLLLLGRLIDRTTVRSLWGVLGLLPAPAGIYPGTRGDGSPAWDGGEAGDQHDHPCANFDMYTADAWDLDLSDDAAAQLQGILDGAAAMHQRLFSSHEAIDPGQRDRMAVIAGVGYRTIFRVARRTFPVGRHVKSRVPGDPHREGDGRVPLASAALEGVPIRYVRTVHSGIPNAPAVYEATFRFLNDEDMGLPKTPEEALADPGAADMQSEAPSLDGSAGTSPHSDEPPYLDEDPPDQAKLDELLTEVDREDLPGFALIRPF